MSTLTIDFDTMRSNCIEIHQQCFELKHVAEKYNVEINIIDYNELKSNPKTKTWDGMGRYAKELLDNQEIWDLLPEKIGFRANDQSYFWRKTEARQKLKDAYQELGGAKL